MKTIILKNYLFRNILQNLKKEMGEQKNEKKEVIKKLEKQLVEARCMADEWYVITYYYL